MPTIDQIASRLRGTRRRIYYYMLDFNLRNGRLPTHREMEDAIGVSLSTVHYHVERLEKMGLLTKYGKHRTVTGLVVVQDDSIQVTE